MGCPECTRLSTLFLDLIDRLGMLRATERRKGLGRVTRRELQRDLEQATADLSKLRQRLLNHEASDKGHWRMPFPSMAYRKRA